jgi:hypothetical protein
MNLRTITFYVVYDHAAKAVIAHFQFKKDILKVPSGCVVVKMKGHYVGGKHG